MSITLESAARLAALRNKADAVTGESSDTLAGAVDALIAGYGQGSGGGDPYTLLESIILGTITEFNYTKEITTHDYRISFGSLFSYNSKLKKWAVPNLTWTPGTYMFQQCNGLTYVDLGKPNSFQAAFFYGFAMNRSETKHIIIRTNTIASLKGTFTGTNVTNAYFYVPKALLSDNDADSDYRRATNWSAYADMFRALEDYTVDGTAAGELDMSKV